MIDRTTKLLLAVVALGLWAHVVVQFRPTPALAGEFDYVLLNLDAKLQSIDLILQNIANGRCRNNKLC